jgi:hypothetical protein
MGQIYRTKHHHHPQNDYMESPIASMSIALALHATEKHNPQVLRISICMLHTMRPGDNGISYEIISQTRKLRQYSNAPSRSENDSRAVFQSCLNSELDDPFIAHLEISGLNVNLELDDLSLARVEISGLDVDLELMSLSLARVKFSGLELDSLSAARVELSESNVDSALDGLSVARLKCSSLKPMSFIPGTVVF